VWSSEQPGRDRDNIGVLLLFDIDGTLLQRASREHAVALYEALGEVYGVRDPQAAGVQAAGRTDLEIARAILVSEGVSARRIDARMDHFAEVCCRRFARLCPDSLVDRVAPGIAALLDWLSADGRAHVTLVTGNLQPIARLKLARAGIGHHFAPGQGGFGSDSEDRLDLPPLARRRAVSVAWGGPTAAEPQSASGPEGLYARRRTLVIGDTPRDIACARADGLRCIAVSTGPYGAAELTQADAVAGDAAHLHKLLAVELERSQ